MIYRQLGNTGLRISALSFGSMRWMSEDDCHRIINRGLDLGMNYVDTSTGYVAGQSDIWTANAIRQRRGDIYFSSKSHWAQAPSADDVRSTIEIRLAKLRLDWFDMYQVWGLGSMDGLRQVLRKGGTLDGVRRAQEAGLIRHGLGFTFHGSAEAFRAAVDSGEFISATVSYNLMNREEEHLIDYAAAHGVGVIVMNPLAGGVLAMTRDPRLDFLREGGPGPWHGALRFLLANTNITTSLLGLTTPREVDLDLRSLEHPDELTEEYRQQLIAAMGAVELGRDDLCTGCGYCADCPSGFKPHHYMTYLRDFDLHRMDEARLREWLASRYSCNGRTPEEMLPKCTECGNCEEECPRKLPIVKAIQRGKAVLRP